MPTFQDIVAWKKAHEFVIDVYRTTALFPSNEKFGLCSQFQRAAVSVPANIAEGFRRYGRAEKLRFLNISQGSLEECRYYIFLSKDLGYIDASKFDELKRMIETTSWYLNAYCKGIIENSSIK